jgi:putative transposase
MKKPSYLKIANHYKDKESVQKWAGRFVGWYTEGRCHSGIKCVSPQQRHGGSDILILEERKRVYEAAKARMPARLSRGIRNWDDIKDVFLNPEKSSQKIA